MSGVEMMENETFCRVHDNGTQSHEWNGKVRMTDPVPQ